ncbi:MAG: transporter [Rhizobacter sp.]|nr:transporter [Rhizobacter sp.]
MSTAAAAHVAPVPNEPIRTAVWFHIFAGLCAGLVSIGLARFAYTPLIPSLIQAHWFSADDVITLGAANLAGYLVGALLGRPVAARLSNEHTLRLMMLLATASFLACAFPLSVAWYFGWRFISGVAGGAIMVLVAATVLPHVPAARKGLASGAIFLGLGLGIAGSGTVVPLLLGLGLRDTWIGLAVLSGVLTAASWFAWPASTPRAKSAPPQPAQAATQSLGTSIRLLYVQYALMAFGLVPAMVFFVDYIARGLGAGAHFGSLFWILYGVGAIFGPPLYGLLADRVGGRMGFRLVLAVQLVAVLGLCATRSFAVIAVLTVVIGSFPPGIVPLALARVHEALPGRVHDQNLAWSRATTVFAAFQALAGYSYSAIFNASGGSHRLLFLIGAAAVAIALIADALVAKTVTE